MLIQFHQSEDNGLTHFPQYSNELCIYHLPTYPDPFPPQLGLLLHTSQIIYLYTGGDT